MDGNNLSYDEAGNLTQDMDGYTYHYDYENRIVLIRKNNDADDVAEFTYDALGRRIEMKDSITSANTRRFYYNDNWQVLAEYDTSNVAKRWYVYGNYIDEVLITSTSTATNYMRFYSHDHLYSPVVTLSNWYVPIDRFEYDAYGNCYVLDSGYTTDADGLSDIGNVYYFTGRRLDILDGGDLKLQYNRNRYYDCYMGRWLTQDPLGIVPNQHRNQFNPDRQYKDGPNLYEYVRSRPISNNDYLGLATECPGGKWWFAGKMITTHLGACTVQRGEFKWACRKRKIIQYNVYECLNSADNFEQPVYGQAVVKGTIWIYGVAVGAGIERQYIKGCTAGAETGEELAGWSWSRPGFSASCLIGSAGRSGWGDNASGSGSLGWSGLGVGFDLICAQRAKIKGPGYEFMEKPLEDDQERSVKNGVCVKVKTRWATPVERKWEDVPETEGPSVHWKSIEEDEQ